MEIGFVGLGSIGMPIAINLYKSGFNLKIHTRSRKNESNPDLLGCKSCHNPYEVARDVDLLLLCLTDDKAVNEVLFGKNGAIGSLRKDSVVIDFSTISYINALKFHNCLLTKSIKYFDSPVSGGTEAARSGSLTIFVGGYERELDFIKPIYSSIGQSVFYFGHIGNGQKVKALNQILVAGSFASVAEAMALGQKMNLPMDIVIDSLQTGAGNSWALEHRALSMTKGNYPLGFKLELHEKDLNIALECSSEVGVKMPITRAIYNLEKRLISLGFGQEDVSALRRINK